MRDLKGTQCPANDGGVLDERSLWDDWHGFVTCNVCLQRVKRWDDKSGRDLDLVIDDAKREAEEHVEQLRAGGYEGAVIQEVYLRAPASGEPSGADAAVREVLDALDMAWELLIHAAPNAWANGNTSPTGIDEGEVRTANAISDIEAVLRKHGRLPTAPDTSEGE